jgi:hypothetical protein
VEKILQDYPLPVLGLAVFACVCVMVALHGRAVHWQQKAHEHEGHHHRFKASHSSLAVRQPPSRALCSITSGGSSLMNCSGIAGP